MAIVGRARRVEIPHESGQWVELRELSGLELDDAREAQSDRFMAKMAQLDPKVTEMFRTSPGTQEVDPAVQLDPSAAYDKVYLLRAVEGWSYDEPCTPENKALLDPETLEWVLKEIVKRNTRTVGESQSSGAFSTRE